MKYPKASSYDPDLIKEKIMGPNPLKLAEELLQESAIPAESVIMDLGSGTGITSVFLAQQYHYTVYAVDLWSDPSENMRFFESCGLSNKEIVPVKADATQMPFAHEFFDAVVSIDSYNYFGRDAHFLDEQLLPFVKKGGYLYLSFPGMVKDCHDNLPDCLLASWTPEQLEYMHDSDWWTNMFNQSQDAQLLSITSMESTEEAWADWLECENDYARSDRASIEAGALDYLSTIAVVLQKL